MKYFFLSLVLSSCFFSRPQDEKFSNDNRLFILQTPNPGLVGGAFVNRFDPNNDTLILPSNTDLGTSFGFEYRNAGQIFFLLTHDSSEKNILLHGTLSYSRWTAEGGDSTGYLSLYPTNTKSAWTARVYLEDSAANVKRLVIRDFYEHAIHVDPLKVNLSGDPVEYEAPVPLLNSRGKPYRFEKIIFLER